MITVFTPTHNRCEFLQRAYASLCRQTSQDFEWLIVDDGSTDDTAIWCKHFEKCWTRGKFITSWLTIPHGGKHIAHNNGVDLARGDWLLVLDDDDELVPGAIEKMHAQIKTISADHVAMIGKCLSDGELHPTEECFVVRTKVLSRYKFPRLKGFVPEGVVWWRLPGKWRQTNEVWRIYHQDAPHRLSNVRPSLWARLAWYRTLLTACAQYATRG